MLEDLLLIFMDTKEPLVILHIMGYNFDHYPEEVIKGLQNISIKISPVVDIELMTRFDTEKDFNSIYKKSILASLKGHKSVEYRV